MEDSIGPVVMATSEESNIKGPGQDGSEKDLAKVLVRGQCMRSRELERGMRSPESGPECNEF